MKLFISYSRDDAGNFANHIHRFMRSKGHDVFIDVNSITIGDPWARSIEKNISECDIFVVILTPDSLNSSYVEQEVLQAQKQNKIIVPCIHEHVEHNEIKWSLERIQGIEFSDKFELALNLYPKIKNYENKKLIDINNKTIGINDNQKETKIKDNASTHSTQWYLDNAKVFEKLRQYEKALEQYEKAIEKEPYNFVAKSNRDIVLEIIKKQGNNSIKDNKKALVIGVSDYHNYPELIKPNKELITPIALGLAFRKNKRLKSIKFTSYDSHEISNVLKENGYDIPDHYELIGYVDSTRLKNTIYDFFYSEEITSDDTLIFYYSGYGVLNKLGKIFLAPSDMNPDHPFLSGFSFDDLIYCMLGCKSRYVVTILDCVFGNLQTSKGFTAVGGEGAATSIANNIIEENSEKLKEGVGRCLLAASQGYEEAYDRQEKDHSIFTYYLLEGLKGHKDAVDDEGIVTFDTLSKFIIREMENLPAEKRPKQKPIIKGEISVGNIIFATFPNLRQA